MGKKEIFCYIEGEGNMPEKFVKKTRELWPKKFMIIGAKTFFGTFLL